MNQSELVSNLAAKTRMKDKSAGIAVEGMLQIITETLSKGEEVKLHHFCTFSVKEYEEHMARNPKTGEKVTVPSRRKVVFKASKMLKAKIK